MARRDGGGLVDYVVTRHAGGAAGGLGQRGHHAHGGGLAGAVGAEHAEHGALGNAQADAVDRHRLAEVLDEVFRLDGRG